MEELPQLRTNIFIVELLFVELLNCFSLCVIERRNDEAIHTIRFIPRLLRASQ